jgi:hypothetical protein
MNAFSGSRAYPAIVASAGHSSIAVALIAIAAAVVVGFIVFCLTDLARADEVRYLPKWAWALIIIFLHILGGIAYLIFGRKQ